MSTPMGGHSPAFYTVPEAATVLRVDPKTLYRAIREDAFPAVRLRSRYVIPTKAVEALAHAAADSGGVVDVARLAAERRLTRQIERAGGASW